MDWTRRTVSVIALAILAVPTGVEPQAPFDVRAAYTKTEHMIPMRDGVKLFTIVYAPKDQSQRYPIMLHRTPYGSPPYGPDNYRRTLGPSPEFAKEGFVFVYQDVRGKFQSEGEFVVMRPIQRASPRPRSGGGGPASPKLRSGEGGTDESTDTFD